MANTLLDEILGVRSMLGNPLPQSPSPEEIVEELEAVYQDVTNLANNTGNAWAVDSLTLTTVAGTREYQLQDTEATDFYKALIVTTVPPDSATPEYTLEMAELEHLPQEWAWLSQNQGSLFWTSHSSQLIAFYRKMGVDGEEIWCELRPTPNSVQEYKILYQQGHWWDTAITAGNPYQLPHQEYKFHFRAQACWNLLPRCRWSYGDDSGKMASVKEMLGSRIAKGAKAFDDYIASLDNQDTVWLDSYADIIDPYYYPLRYR